MIDLSACLYSLIACSSTDSESGLLPVLLVPLLEQKREQKVGDDVDETC